MACGHAQYSEPESVAAPKTYKLAQLELSEEHNENFLCETLEPYTGALNFPSKYQGSGAGRDLLNPQSTSLYEQSTKPIKDFSLQIANLAKKLQGKKPLKMYSDCFYSGLERWAQAGALMDKDANGTGKAVRKWTLASLASHYLIFDDLGLANPNQSQRIESWFYSLAQQVQHDYSNRPLEKTNNHDYWAAWSIMLVSTIVDDHELYSWSLAILNTAIDQIDDNGLLPNELKRETKAFTYHNFSMLSLASVAAFAYANGDDVTARNKNGLFRLAENILQPNAPAYFEALTGSEQTEYRLDINGRLSWVPALMSIGYRGNALGDFIGSNENYQQHGSTRLGGNACLRFGCL